MADQHKPPEKADTQKDKVDRPMPGILPVEGDEETIEEDLEQKSQPKKRSGGGAA